MKGVIEMKEISKIEELEELIELSADLKELQEDVLFVTEASCGGGSYGFPGSAYQRSPITGW